MRKKYTKKRYETTKFNRLALVRKPKKPQIRTEYQRIATTAVKYLVSISLILLHNWVTDIIANTGLTNHYTLSICAGLSLGSAIYLIWQPKPNMAEFQKFLGRILQAIAKAIS